MDHYGIYKTTSPGNSPLKALYVTNSPLQAPYAVKFTPTHYEVVLSKYRYFEVFIVFLGPVKRNYVLGG